MFTLQLHNFLLYDIRGWICYWVPLSVGCVTVGCVFNCQRCCCFSQQQCVLYLVDNSAQSCFHLFRGGMKLYRYVEIGINRQCLHLVALLCFLYGCHILWNLFNRIWHRILDSSYTILPYHWWNLCTPELYYSPSIFILIFLKPIV